MRIESTDVLGHSDGGILGIALAMRYPQKVRRLVSSSPNLRPDPTALLPFFAEGVRKQSAQAAEMIKANDRSRDWVVRKRQLDLMLEEPNIPVSDLKRITAPTLIVGGDEDIMPLEHLIEIYTKIPKRSCSLFREALTASTANTNSSIAWRRSFSTSFLKTQEQRSPPPAK